MDDKQVIERLREALKEVIAAFDAPPPIVQQLPPHEAWRDALVPAIDRAREVLAQTEPE
jgi:hypothetical protein